MKKGRTRKALTMLLNAKLKKLCGEIGTHFMDFTRNMATVGQMTGDVLHYQEGCVLLVARLLAKVAHRFLGTRRKRWPTPGMGHRKDRGGSRRRAGIIPGTTRQEITPPDT